MTCLACFTGNCDDFPQAGCSGGCRDHRQDRCKIQIMGGEICFVQVVVNR